MILYRADDSWVVWPVSDWGFEDDALVVALAIAPGLDAIIACWALLTTFDASFAAGEAARFGPLPHLGDGGRHGVGGW